MLAQAGQHLRSPTRALDPFLQDRHFPDAGQEAFDLVECKRRNQAGDNQITQVLVLDQQPLGGLHRPPHFGHIFTGGGYASAYYSYMWSEVMDADAFRAFEEAGDVFDPSIARRLYDNIYSAGGRHDPAEAYMAFRGRLPTTEALLEKRGLKGAAA